MKVKRKCAICGAEYWVRNARSKYCSEACKKTGRKITTDKFYELHPDYQREYQKQWKQDNADRVAEYQQKRNDSEEYKEQRRSDWRANHNLTERVFDCPACGAEVRTYKKDQKFCSTRCHDSACNGLKRFAREKIVDRDITLNALIARDDNICHICGEPCDRSDFRVKNGVFIAGHLYPTIDHIKPCCAGGEHSWNNVALAHKICNSIKAGNFE